MLCEFGLLIPGILVEELLIDDVSPATLDDISTLLDPWLVQRSVQQRAAAVYILKTTLQAYYHNMSFGYEVSLTVREIAPLTVMGS